VFTVVGNASQPRREKTGVKTPKIQKIKKKKRTNGGQRGVQPREENDGRYGYWRKADPKGGRRKGKTANKEGKKKGGGKKGGRAVGSFGRGFGRNRR